jgi:hypothetical protein
MEGITMNTYMHGGDYSRNIVRHIENRVEEALNHLDIEMPEIENLSYGNDICDSFGFEGFDFQVFIPNCPEELNDPAFEYFAYFGFAEDYNSSGGCDGEEYTLKGIIERIVSYVRACKVNQKGG